jgi:uncharacterized protein DUF5372
MSEDALVNIGAVEWPEADSAYFAVRRMQIKLHRWAGEDSSRRFGDLFNLVYDPAFLVHAWERVSSNTGARTAGIDRVTVTYIESRVGITAFLDQLRNSLKSGEFRPVEVRQTMIPKGRSGNCESWVFRRRRHSAASSSDGLGFVVVTHPFHALSGQRLEVLFVKRRGGDSVFVCSGGVSGQVTVSRSWTDRGEPSQPHRLSAEGMAELFAVTRAIQGR